jgi:hypothetical protein
MHLALNFPQSSPITQRDKQLLLVVCSVLLNKTNWRIEYQALTSPPPAMIYSSTVFICHLLLTLVHSTLTTHHIVSNLTRDFLTHRVSIVPPICLSPQFCRSSIHRLPSHIRYHPLAHSTYFSNRWRPLPFYPESQHYLAASSLPPLRCNSSSTSTIPHSTPFLHQTSSQPLGHFTLSCFETLGHFTLSCLISTK